jgi:hypothetical protein
MRAWRVMVAGALGAMIVLWPVAAFWTDAPWWAPLYMGLLIGCLSAKAYGGPQV